MGTKSTNYDFSIKNLNSLKAIHLSVIYTIDQDVLTRLLDQVQNIESLHLDGRFGYFCLDSLTNLKSLSLEGAINSDFNLELFKSLSYQLENIMFNIINTDHRIFPKLFYGHNFPYLEDFSISKCNIKVFKKELINYFPMLRRLCIKECKVEMIEADSFSNLKQLESFALIGNPIKFIEKDTFSNLKYLQNVDLSNNKITKLDPEFIGLKNSVKIILDN